MKTLGMVRNIDELGRVVIPIELRRTMGIEEKDSMDIFVDGDSIVLKKYTPGCVLCGGMENLIAVCTDKLVCESCIDLAANKA